MITESAKRTLQQANICQKGVAICDHRAFSPAAVHFRATGRSNGSLIFLPKGAEQVTNAALESSLEEMKYGG